MGDTKTFTTRFDLFDNFSQKYAAIQKLIQSITQTTHKINFDIDSGMMQQTQELNNKLEGSVAGITKTTEAAKSATKGHAEAQKEAGKQTEQHMASTKKAGNVISELKSKYEGLTSSVMKFAGSLAAMATGGAVAGLSYISAAQTNLRIQDTVEAVSGNRKNRVSAPQLESFIKSYSGSGWTSSGKISETVEAAYLYGGKKARGQKGLDLAEAAEKIAYAKQESLGGMTGTDLMRSATIIKGKLRPQQEAEFRTATANVMGLPGYESMIKTASGRLKLLKKEAEEINIKAEMDKRPWAVAQQNISDFKKAIGDSIASPMGKISVLIAKVAKSMKDVPGLAGIIGWAAILMSLAGAASMGIMILTPLASAIMMVARSQRVAALATWAWNTALTVAKFLNPFAPIIIAATVIIGLFGFLAVKSGALNALWKDLGKIWKDLTHSKSEKVLPDIGKIIGKIDLSGVFKTAVLGPLGLIGAGSDDIKEKIWAGMMGLLNWVRTSFPFLSKIHDVMKKIHSIFEWIYSLW
jgi:hypothetical protein